MTPEAAAALLEALTEYYEAMESGYLIRLPSIP